MSAHDYSGRRDRRPASTIRRAVRRDAAPGCRRRPARAFPLRGRSALRPV